ncbi:MAG: hypothetical protein ABL876_18045, partial [Chitinophagaceae bacterium]
SQPARALALRAVCGHEGLNQRFPDNCYTSESLEFNHPSMQHNIYWKTSYILETACLPVTIHPLASEVLERQFLMVIIK